VVALGLEQIVCWGVVYYVLAVVQVPMRAELGWTTAQTTAAFSLALLISALSGVAIAAGWTATRRGLVLVADRWRGSRSSWRGRGSSRSARSSPCGWGSA
jgi:hypothetical protein